MKEWQVYGACCGWFCFAGVLENAPSVLNLPTCPERTCQLNGFSFRIGTYMVRPGHTQKRCFYIEEMSR